VRYAVSLFNKQEKRENKMANWKEWIGKEMEENGDSWEEVVSSTLSDEELIEEFHAPVFCSNEGGKTFTVWTKNRVYFPVNYDCFQSVGSVARFPDGVPTDFIGGG
jgi:hypothetical protein